MHQDKPLVWLHGEIKSPPLSDEARVEAGYLLRKLQQGDMLSMPMPNIGSNCHELRIVDQEQTWRVIYRIDPDAVIIADVFSKKTKRTPKQVIENCKRRLRYYDESATF